MVYTNSRLAGAALFVGIVQFALAEMIAEFFYPGYGVSRQPISDLGATCENGVCQIVEPSSLIFNSSIILAGLLVLVSSYYIRRTFRDRIFLALFTIAGLGLIALGSFPETTGVVHGIFSGVTFLSISVGAIVAYRVEKPPLSYFSVVLGAGALMAAVLYEAGIYLGLGQGGMERMIVYPVLLWSVAFGGDLMSRDTDSWRKQPG